MNTDSQPLDTDQIAVAISTHTTALRARPGATSEDDGVLLCLLNDEVARTTSLVVLDAATMALQARLRLPRALPYGFHGDWEPEYMPE